MTERDKPNQTLDTTKPRTKKSIDVINYTSCWYIESHETIAKRAINGARSFSSIVLMDVFHRAVWRISSRKRYSVVQQSRCHSTTTKTDWLLEIKTRVVYLRHKNGKKKYSWFLSTYRERDAGSQLWLPAGQKRACGWHARAFTSPGLCCCLPFLGGESQL